VRLRALAAATAVAALAAAGAGAGSVAAARTAASRAPSAVPVREREYRLSPSRFAVTGAGIVRFRGINKGKRVHELAITGRGVHAHTARIRPGHSAVLKVRLISGRYRIYCPLHPQMRGTIAITVGQEGNPGPG
jgi:plastocyanin